MLLIERTNGPIRSTISIAPAAHHSQGCPRHRHDVFTECSRRCRRVRCLFPPVTRNANATAKESDQCTCKKPAWGRPRVPQRQPHNRQHGRSALMKVCANDRMYAPGSVCVGALDPIRTAGTLVRHSAVPPPDAAIRTARPRRTSSTAGWVIDDESKWVTHRHCGFNVSGLCSAGPAPHPARPSRPADHRLSDEDHSVWGCRPAKRFIPDVAVAWVDRVARAVRGCPGASSPATQGRRTARTCGRTRTSGVRRGVAG